MTFLGVKYGGNYFCLMPYGGNKTKSIPFSGTAMYFTNGKGTDDEYVAIHNGIGNLQASTHDGLEDVYVPPGKSVDDRSNIRPANELSMNPKRPKHAKGPDSTIYEESHYALA